MTLKIKSGETILFIGDSITDCGRRAENSPLGNGYVKLFSDLISIREPAKKIDIINKGIGGDRVTGLRNRWSDDVLRNKPDWLSIKIGINDLHSFLMNMPEMVSPKVFEQAYDDILAGTKKTLLKCKILLIEPFYISIEKSSSSFKFEVLKLLPKYINVVRAMSRKYKTRLVRTQDIFANLLKHYEADKFCPEPVHPNQTGHLVIAEAVYKVLSK
ncbi:MAG: SGNH/GDSL hydrolase family protein [Sedimentisphaerales bacterium]